MMQRVPGCTGASRVLISGLEMMIGPASLSPMLRVKAVEPPLVEKTRRPLVTPPDCSRPTKKRAVGSPSSAASTTASTAAVVTASAPAAPPADSRLDIVVRRSMEMRLGLLLLAARSMLPALLTVGFTALGVVGFSSPSVLSVTPSVTTAMAPDLDLLDFSPWKLSLSLSLPPIDANLLMTPSLRVRGMPRARVPPLSLLMRRSFRSATPSMGTAACCASERTTGNATRALAVLGPCCDMVMDMGPLLGVRLEVPCTLDSTGKPGVS
mmetsp:Transcript_20815/g.52495  ORF Transcript_20815/g.52495 Transcript_20815/m.52495 type:complete len:267 (+) Transcript_20815:443-1243(+)